MADSHNLMMIFTGLPASGKSTLAKEWLAEDPLHRRSLNYDELRIELNLNHRDMFNAKAEEAMKRKALDRVEGWLLDGMSVCIDNCNLGPAAYQRWERLAANFGIRTEFHHIDVPIDVCIQRDKLRPEGSRVGRAVIERIALFNGFIDWSAHLPSLGKKDIVICDIDGTIADLSHRLHHVKDGNHRWDKFHEEVDKDEPIEDIIRLARLLKNDGYHIIMVSGRSIGHGCGIKTEDWLDKHMPIYSALFMRQSGDHRQDMVIKKEILDLLPKDRVAYVLDDRPQVIRMWQANGLRTLAVGPLTEF